MTTLDTYLRAQANRCSGCGYAEIQGCHCTPADDWSTFTAALRSVARVDGTVHASDMRPLLRGRIAPRTLSTLWKRGRDERLLVEAGHERSDDVLGKNAGRMEPFYTYRSTA